MSVAADRCAHWQADWGAGQTHCRQCRKNAMFPPPVIKSKSGSVAVTGVLAFLQRVRRHLSCVADCSGGNASAGNIFLAAMHSNPTAWGDTQRALHQPQIEGLLNAASTISPRIDDSDHNHLRGACVVELGAGKGILGRVLSSYLGGQAIFVERRDVFDFHTFDHISDNIHNTDRDVIEKSSVSSRVCLDVASLDLPALFQVDAPPAAGVLVCAKHLCGLGTDLALDCIERAQGWSPLRGILIAPCCHQTIDWDALPESFRQWFVDRGFESSWWNVLKLLLHSSKSGKAIEHFGSFSALSDFSPLYLYSLGRLARRCMEEARCCRLNNLGFATRIFRYCPTAVSPDNLVIVAQPRGPTQFMNPVPRLPSAICSRNVPHTPAGVILRLESSERAGSIVARLYSSRQHSHQTYATVLFDVAWEQTLYMRKEPLEKQEAKLSLRQREYEVVVVINCSSLSPLLAHLGSDRVLRCVIRQIIPFCHQSSSTAVLQRDARSFLSKFSREERSSANDDDAVRLLCWPPSLLDELKLAAATAASPPSAEVISSAAAAASAFALKMHPTQYTAALCAVEWLSIDCASDEVCCEEVLHSYGKNFADIEEAHRIAVESEQLQYEDPHTGWKVFSQLSSSSRGYCCGMGCRHCIFGHENVDSGRKSSAKAPISINGARRSIFWSLLSQDEVSQLLLPAATFCSDAERSFERLSEVVELHLIDISKAHIAIVRDETTVDANSASQLTIAFLKQKGALSVSQFVFKAGQLVFVGSENFRCEPVPGVISLVISHANVLSYTISDKCDGMSKKYGCTDLVRVLAQVSSYSHLSLAPCCPVVYRVSLSPTLKCLKDKKKVPVRAVAMCAGEFSQEKHAETFISGFEEVKIFHALSDRKFERTVVAKLVTRTTAPSHLLEAGNVPLDEAFSVQQLCPAAFNAMRAAGKAYRLIDVRNLWEIHIASLPEARLLDAEYQSELMSLPRDTNLVFLCHHGIRSQRAAETFSHLGFHNVFNLEGGIDAWSTLVDPDVARY